MTFNYVNQRATAGYVTDAGGDSYSTGETTISGRTVGGFRFVWAAAPTSDNQSAAQDPHVAGANSATSGTVQFTLLDLVPGHTYNFKLYLGKYNAGIALTCGWSCLNTDNTTAHSGANATIPDGEARDAVMSTTYASPAALVAASGGASVSITPTGNSLKFTKGSNNMILMSIGIEDPSPPVTATSSTAMMMGV